MDLVALKQFKPVEKPSVPQSVDYSDSASSAPEWTSHYYRPIQYHKCLASLINLQPHSEQKICLPTVPVQKVSLRVIQRWVQGDKDKWSTE